MSKSAQERYEKANTVRVTIKLNKRTDAEAIEMLSSATSKQGLIKAALKEYQKNHKNFCKNS